MGFFTIDLKLVKGFKYRFCFFLQPEDRPIVDKNHIAWSVCHRELPFGLKESNYLEVKIGENDVEDFPEEVSESL
jgi:hypothetical protein